MPTSETYAFAPSLGEGVLSAFARIKIQPSAVSGQHMWHARNEANYLQVEWANKGPNLWNVDLVVTPLVPGQTVYPVQSNTVMILDAYISTTPPSSGDFMIPDYSGDFNIANSDSGRVDTVILPMGRTEYAGISRKGQMGRPTSYWYDRLASQLIYLWPAPNTAYWLSYYRFRQIQDAEYPNNGQPEVTYLMLDALVAGLAYRMARIYNQELEAVRKVDYKEAWLIAAAQNTENAPLYIEPELDSYWQP